MLHSKKKKETLTFLFDVMEECNELFDFGFSSILYDKFKIINEYI